MINDPTGNTWTRSDDGRFIVSSDSKTIQIFPESTDEQLSESIAMLRKEWDTPQKSDAERIAELEAQLAAILAKLS